MGDNHSRNYRQPPDEFKFKPGQSGNPNGRPRGARGLRTDLAAELDARQTINIGKKPVTGTRQRLMLRTLAIRAAAGDVKATALLLGIVTQVLGADDRGKSKKSFSASDQAFLDQYARQLGTGDDFEGDEPAGSSSGPDISGGGDAAD